MKEEQEIPSKWKLGHWETMHAKDFGTIFAEQERTEAGAGWPFSWQAGTETSAPSVLVKQLHKD